MSLESFPSSADEETDAFIAERERKGAFYESVRPLLEEMLDAMDADPRHPDALHANAFKQEEGRILMALDDATGGDASKVTEELVMKVFKGM